MKGFYWGERSDKVRLWLVIAVVTLPWLLASSPLWQFSKDTFIVPLASDLFDLSFAAFGDHRIVLSTWLIHPLLVSYSFIGPLLLVLMFLIADRAFHELKWRGLLSFAVVLAVYRLGAPGTTPLELLQLVFLGICLTPLLTPTHPLLLWLAAALVLGIAQLSRQNEFLIFWITLSLSVGYLIHYILAQKTALPKKLRDQFVITALSAFGLTCLAISVLAISLKLSLDHHLIQSTPDRWWLAWILGVLSVALCWLRPWETHRWLCLAIFGHGIFLTPDLELPLWIAIVWSILQILNRLPTESFMQKIPLKGVSPKWVSVSLIVLILGIEVYQIRQFRPIRSFRPGWVTLAKELQTLNRSGYLVVGEGTSFLAHFSAARFAEDPTLMTVETEDELAERLHTEEFESILVDTRFATDFWKKWIKEGGEIEKSNHSVITRLITDGGKEIRLRTLNVDAIKNFKITFLKAKDFALIQPTNPE